MPVPETAVHEDYAVQSRADDVGFPGQILPVERIAKSQRMNHPPDLKLGSRVLAPYQAHALTSL